MCPHDDDACACVYAYLPRLIGTHAHVSRERSRLGRRVVSPVRSGERGGRGEGREPLGMDEEREREGG